ncbi:MULTISPECIES: serine hydrolase [Myroides]|uniref:Serine hydrolase n=1 Tax=Myroides albus TaxID=2562892 RepID=A0A6I3LNX4_9FLAO|nr:MULTISPECIES: serine hydrolase [Myroides]MTG98341.1 serine hydrolase [Myroides albus]MVX36788.1 serine hydrolase [Myroides sp. LoEW2-1]UVD79586.1 beta-lactamase family protein [Myroides albus]
MKRIKILFLLTLLSIGVVHAQEKEKNVIVETFVKDYNSEDYDDFYTYFSTSLKEELPFNQAKNFFVEMKGKMGNIKSIEFYGLDDNQLALYRTEFENKEVALLNLAINSQGELEGFRIIDMPDNNKKASAITQKSNQDILLESAKGLPAKGQFAVAIIDNDQVNYFGVENKKGKIVLKDNRENLFSMANFATIYTSTLFAKAVNQGKIELTQDANDFYDFEFNNKVRLPLTKLANHTSFVPMLPPLESVSIGEDEFFSGYNQNQLHEYLKNQLTIDSLNMQLKQSFSFLGYAILGDVVSKALESDFNTLVEDQIFKPYKMNSSIVDYQKKNKKILKGINRLGQESTVVPVSMFKYATSTYSNTVDLGKFVQAQFDPTDEDLSLTRRASVIVSPTYWLSSGWKIAFPFGNDTKLYFSRAVDSGYSNYVGFDPVKKKGLIILANSSTEESLKSLDELSFQLMMKLLKN